MAQFRFESRMYVYKEKLTPQGQAVLQGIYEQGIREHKSARWMVEQARSKGVSYRYQEMLRDIARARFTERARTRVSYYKKQAIFNTLEIIKGVDPTVKTYDQALQRFLEPEEVDWDTVIARRAEFVPEDEDIYPYGFEGRIL